MNVVVRQFGLNWFTTVMGVGIVAGLTYGSPLSIPFQHALGTVLFVLLNVIFVAASLLWAFRWIFHTDEAINDFRYPNRALFYGAFAMGINVVGNDYLVIGTHMMSGSVATDISKVVWLAGTIVSLFTVIVVPYLLFVKHEVKQHDTLATWLIPVVPPIVAAATGANLIPFWGVGVWWIIISAMHTFLHLGKRGEGLPFHMGWWSYVFPIGSFTNGTYALDHLVNHSFFTIAGFIQLIILWGCFVIVFTRTTRGVWNGSLIPWNVSHVPPKAFARMKKTG